MDSIASEDVVLELEYEIEEDVEAELEDFVRLNHTGQFKDAHKLFDECLSRYDGWYPVAAEYADCLLREGDFEQLSDFSLDAVERFQDPNEKVLLQLMTVIGSRTNEGIMLEKLRELRDKWPGDSMKPPYTSLKDTDIHILEICLQILLLTEPSPEDVDPWGVFEDWFYYLLYHKYFWEAQRIFHSLIHRVPMRECQDMLRDYINKAVSTNIGQESVQIGISSLVQRFIFVVESPHPSPLAVVQWNDAITWALFGIMLAKPGDCPTPLIGRIYLRRSLEEKLKAKLPLPLDGVHGDDEISNSLFEAVKNGDVSAIRQTMITESIHYTLDELNSMALIEAAQRDSEDDLKPFINPRTIDARDGYQRTSLHYASLNGQLQIVELLLSKGKADAGLTDWFGCTPLHYAVTSDYAMTSPYAPISDTKRGQRIQIVKMLLESHSASVNKKDRNGLTAFRMAFLDWSLPMAKTLLQHGAIVGKSDCRDILTMDELSEWRELLSGYAHPEYTLYVGNLPMNTSEVGLRDELKALFSEQSGYKRLCLRTKWNAWECFVEFEDRLSATFALVKLDGHPLYNSVKDGIRLSFSKNDVKQFPRPTPQ